MVKTYEVSFTLPMAITTASASQNCSVFGNLWTSKSLSLLTGLDTLVTFNPVTFPLSSTQNSEGKVLQTMSTSYLTKWCLSFSANTLVVRRRLQNTGQGHVFQTGQGDQGNLLSSVVSGCDRTIYSYWSSANNDDLQQLVCHPSIDLRSWGLWIFRESRGSPKHKGLCLH